ncbi:hypothetical protein HRF87_21700 [Bacillus sp. CRN 9]|nr:hypothetical protein [Bacillus sp. CRN 9]
MENKKYRVFDPHKIEILFKADTYKECLDFRVTKSVEDFQLASRLRIIEPNDESFIKTFGHIKYRN